MALSDPRVMVRAICSKVISSLLPHEQYGGSWLSHSTVVQHPGLSPLLSPTWPRLTHPYSLASLAQGQLHVILHPETVGEQARMGGPLNIH